MVALAETYSGLFVFQLVIASRPCWKEKRENPGKARNEEVSGRRKRGGVEGEGGRE